MNVKKYMFIIFSMFFVAMSANAEQTSWGTISMIKTVDSQAYIYVDELETECDKDNRVRLYWSLPAANQFFSLLMSAQMGEKDVSFEGTCVSGYLSVSAVWVRS